MNLYPLMMLSEADYISYVDDHDMNKLTPPHWAFMALFFILLSGCAVLTPQTPSQIVYAAFGGYTSVVNTTAQLLETDVITVEQAKTVQAEARPLRADIDRAKSLVDLKLPVGDDLLSRVEASQMILLKLQRYLEAQK